LFLVITTLESYDYYVNEMLYFLSDNTRINKCFDDAVRHSV